jgi:acetoin utilization deacetylase AcuC-like enzyme
MDAYGRAGAARARPSPHHVDVRAAGLLFEHPSSREHDPRGHVAGHPETPERIVAVDAALAAADWLGWERRAAPPATRAELEAVHARELIDRIEGLSAAGGGAVDADTFVGESSWRAALHASGGACAMVRALLAGDARAGFALLRPPGHHAERARAMGFCLFNNAAVAAQLAIAELGVRRVLIVDWDVHHGNGTAEIFRRRDDVLYASIHREGFYPGTGPLADAGSGAGLGYTLNLPVHAGTEGEAWRSLLEHVALPAAASFAPELVLISAGFDAHRADPLGGCRLETEDFAQMACQVRDLAGRFDAPVGAVLEGGYEPRALADCVLATMRALGGTGAAESIAPDPVYTQRAASYVGRYWEL